MSSIAVRLARPSRIVGPIIRLRWTPASSLHPRTYLSPPRETRACIIPVYETLRWIVLRNFLEVRFRSTPNDQHAYRLVFRDYLDNPTRHKFEQKKEPKISVKAVVKEVLRLYPSSPWIYRKIGPRLNTCIWCIETKYPGNMTPCCFSQLDDVEDRKLGVYAIWSWKV